MTEIEATLWAAVVGALIGGGIAYLISNKQIGTAHRNALELIQRQESLRVASKFKASIIYELSGFYPVNQYWDKDNFDRLYKSIPRVMSAAAEFRFYVSRKDDFDTAIKDYDEYCRLTKFDEIISPDKFPSMSYIDKREQFKNIVGHLISFVDEIFNKAK